MTIRPAGLGKWICDARHPEGYACTRERAHKDEHAAHDLEGHVVKTWRGDGTREKKDLTVARNV